MTRTAFILVVLGACGAEPTRGEAPTEARPAAPPSCAALPPVPPAELTVERTRRGGEPEGAWITTVVARGTPCPTVSPHQASLDELTETARSCVALSPEAMDALHRELASLALERVRVRVIERPSPHRGGSGLRVRWDGGRCEIADLLDREVLPESAPVLARALAIVDDAIARGAPAMGTCVAEDPAPPWLDAFTDAVPGSRHRVRVAWDAESGEWMPSPLPAMPLHHASRLAWENLEPYADVLDASRARSLVFTVTALDRELATPAESARGVPTVRATYRARIESVCGDDG